MPSSAAAQAKIGSCTGVMFRTAPKLDVMTRPLMIATPKARKTFFIGFLPRLSCIDGEREPILARGRLSLHLRLDDFEVVAPNDALVVRPLRSDDADHAPLVNADRGQNDLLVGPDLP